MTKSTITRERLEEIRDCCWMDDLGLSMYELSELARMALAAMDGEPVAWTWHYREQWHVTSDKGRAAFVAIDGDVDVLPLYRHAQPAPVVPDELPVHAIAPYSGAEYEAGYRDGWNACRAAMLAAAQQSPGSEPATVPGKWIPVSERMPEDSGRYWCYVEEQNDLGKSHYQWNCSWNGDRWWVESEGGGIVTHWMQLPAAPQEVK